MDIRQTGSFSRGSAAPLWGRSSCPTGNSGCSGNSGRMHSKRRQVPRHIWICRRVVLFRRNAEQHHGLHGRTQPCPRVPGPMEQVSGGLVEKKPGCIDIFFMSPLLIVFKKPHASVGRAGSDRLLVFNRRTEIAQVQFLFYPGGRGGDCL